MSLFSFFKRKNEQAEPVTAATLKGEQAVSDASYMYTASDFPRYNPDDLLGRKGAQIYTQMARDEQIKSGLKFKKDAITSRGFSFEIPAESGLSDEERERRVAVFHALVDNIDGSFTDSIVKILRAFQDGYSLTEIVGGQFEHDGLTFEGVKALKLRPAHSFRFKTDAYGNVTALLQRAGSKEAELDYRKFIHFVVNPDIDEQYGESELRSVYRSWFSKDMAIKFRNIYMERHAGGFHVLKPPKDANLQTGSPLFSQLQNIIQNINLTTGVILPSADYSLDSVYPTGSGGNIFGETIKACDLEIARALLIPPLLGVSPQGDTGSYSQANVQLDAFFWTLINDANRLAECLNQQLFKPLGLVNFGDQWFPRFYWNPTSQSKAIEIIRLFMELTNSGVLKRTQADEAFIRSALELPAVQEFASDEEPPAPAPDPTPEPEPEEPPVDDPDGGDTDEEPGDGEGETIIGRQGLAIVNAAFKRAQSRVSFAVIGVGAEGLVEDHVAGVSAVTDQMVREMMSAAQAAGDLTENLLDTYNALTPPKELKGKLKQEVSATLRDGVRLGRKEAAKEVDKAMGEAFSMRANYSRMDHIAEDFYQVEAFRITGNITDEMSKIILAQIINGARYGKAWPEVETAVYTELASAGLLSSATAQQQLGQLLGVTTPDARLRTIVRTSTFGAINNARDAYFTDPQLGGFVRAYEYSAILDSRTTEICRHLDEDNAGDHSIEWYNQNAGYKPPNHFNCRSLLVAVTVNDLGEFAEGPQPTVRPQEGFN